MPIKSYICRPFSLGLLMPIKSYTVLSGPAWACLGLPGPAWACLGLPGPALGLPGPAWASLGLPGPVWACLGCYYLLQTLFL